MCLNQHIEKLHIMLSYHIMLGSPPLYASACWKKIKRGLYFYLLILLWLLVIWGLLLGLKNVIYQLSDPTKGKPPVQISKV